MAFNPFLFHKSLHDAKMSPFYGVLPHPLLQHANLSPPSLASLPHVPALPCFAKPQQPPDLTAASLLQGRTQLQHLQNSRLKHMDVMAAEGGKTEEGRVELDGKELWEKFHEIGTEMVITKSGR